MNRKRTMIFGTVALATIAAVALGTGGAQAATRHLIGSKQIKDHSIRVVDLNPSTVKALKGHNGLNGKAGLNGKDGKAGADGTNGTNGTDGKDGVDGKPGKNGWNGHDGHDGKDASLDTYVMQQEFTVPAGDKAESTTWCHPGDRLLSGGYSSNDNHKSWAQVYQDRMTWSDDAQAAAKAAGKAGDAQPDGWYVNALGGSEASVIDVWAYCTAA